MITDLFEIKIELISSEKVIGSAVACWHLKVLIKIAD